MDPLRWSHFCGEANGITRPVASWVAKRKNHPLARLSQPKPPNKKESFSPALDTVPVTNINTLAFFEVCEHKLHCGNVIFGYSDRSSAPAPNPSKWRGFCNPPLLFRPPGSFCDEWMRATKSLCQLRRQSVKPSELHSEPLVLCSFRSFREPHMLLHDVEDFLQMLFPFYPVDFERAVVPVLEELFH